MSMLTRMLPFAALALAVLAAVASAQEAVPRPPGLSAEVAFWQRAFAECSSEQGLVHDNRHLDIIYEKIDASGEGGPARLQRLAEAARAKYERILRKLASGERNALDAEERRVLALWPADVSNAELREAAGRVRFQQGLAERFHAGLVRSGQWREHIRRSLQQAGVPEEVMALPHVESSFDPGARSFVGAAGLWQFTAGTGKRYLRIDQAVDERRDPFESSEAAARLLRYNHDLLGTWPLAITAYNHGAGGMRRAVEATGTTDIETIIRSYNGPAFRFASRNFYVSFLAALEIEEQPEQYFGPLRRQPAHEPLVVEVPDFMGVDTLERAFGVPRATLQAYNPALLPPVWEGARYVPRGFRLRLPAGGAIKAAPQQVLAAIPASQRFGGQLRDHAYKVQRGDTLSHIARRHGTTVGQLARLNGLKPDARIRVGQSLALPGGAVPATAGSGAGTAGTYKVVRGDTLGGIAGRHGLSVRQLAAANGLQPDKPIRIGQSLKIPGGAPGAVAAAGQVHKVVRGDTLGGIAMRYGVSVRQLAAANGLRPDSHIRIGQSLKIPTTSSAGQTSRPRLPDSPSAGRLA